MHRTFSVLFLVSLFLAQTVLAGQAYLQVFVVDPPHPLNWTSPETLLADTAYNAAIMDYAPNGHFAVHLVYPNRSEGALDILTGMSRANKTKTAEDTLIKGYGLSAMVRTFPGELDAAKGDVVELEKAHKSGRLSSVVIPITDAQAEVMTDFIGKWINYGVYQNYGGAKKVGAGEGAGCADFAIYFMALATDGTMPVKEWLRSRYLPKDLMLRENGGTQSSVAITKMMFGSKAKSWARGSSDGVEFVTPDPELMSKWIKEQMNTESHSYAARTMILANPYDTDQTSPRAHEILADEFVTADKNVVNPLTQNEVWDRITLGVGDHLGHSFLDSPF